MGSISVKRTAVFLLGFSCFVYGHCSQNIEAVIWSSSSLAPCTNADVDTSKFWTADHILKNSSVEECSCSIGTMECPENAEGMTPPKVQVWLGNILNYRMLVEKGRGGCDRSYASVLSWHLRVRDLNLVINWRTFASSSPPTTSCPTWRAGTSPTTWSRRRKILRNDVTEDSSSESATPSPTWTSRCSRDQCYKTLLL